MAYNSIEKQRLEEYERNKKLAQSGGSSINVSNNQNMNAILPIPGAKNYLPTRSGQMARDINTRVPYTTTPTGLQKLGYLGKNFITGGVGGLTGGATAVTTSTANDLEKGNRNGKVNSILGLLQSINEWRNPANALVKNTAKSIKKNIIDDKNSNTWQKGVNTVLDIASPETPINKAVQVYGSVLPNDTSNKVNSLTERISTPYNNLRNDLSNERNNYSNGINIMGDVLQNVGQMIPSVAVTAATKNPNLGLATMGLSAKGNATTEALEKGANLSQAVKIGNLKSQVEIGTEMLSGGLNIFGKGSLDDVSIAGKDKVIKYLSDKGILSDVKKKVLNYMWDKGYDLTGEVLEETISDLVGTAIDKGTVDENASYTLSDWKDTALVTILSTVLLNTLTGGLSGDINKVNREIGTNFNSNINNANDIITNVVSNENVDTQSIVNNLTQEQRNTLSQNISNQLETIENYQKENNLNQEQINDIKTIQKRLTELQNQINNLTNVQNSNTNSTNNISIQTVNDLVSQEQSSNINSSVPNMATVNDLASNSINTNQNTNQLAPVRELSFTESAKKYNIDSNTETIKSIDAVMKQRGIQFRFDSTLFKDDTENALWIPIVNQNRQIIGREIVFNPNATITDQTLEEIAVHEMYHDIFAGGSGEYLQDLIMSFNMRNDGYLKAKNALADTYAEAYRRKGQNVDVNSAEFQQIINEEVVANILGRKLGSQEYINRLVHEKPSLARKIYDFVIDKLNTLNILVGFKNEKIFWTDVKNKFDKAYREEYKNSSQASERFSIQTTENGDKYVNIDTDQDIFKGISPKDYNKIAKMYINDYLRGETTLANNDTAVIDSKSANKYTNPGKKQPNFKEKMRLTPELKNVLEISQKEKTALPTKDTSKYPNWEYYKFNFKLDNELFSGIVNIGIDKNNVKHFYEVNNIKKASGISDVSPNRPTGFSENNISQSNKNVKSDISTKYSIQENRNNTQELDDSSFSVDNLPKVKDGYTRLYRGLNNEYNPNYDRSQLDSPNGYDTLTDNYELAKAYGDNVYYIDIPTKQIANSVIDENPNSETYGDRNLVYKDDKSAGINGASGNEYLLYTDHDNFDYTNYHRIDNSNTRYSQNSNNIWQEYLDKYYPSEGTGTRLKDIKLPVREDVAKKVTSNLTQDEQHELNVLKQIDNTIGLDSEDTNRLEYLKNKEKGYKTKFPELKKNITYNDIKSEYAKYRDLNGFNSKLLDTAKSFVPDYRNTGKRSKEGWLNVANFIGSNIKTNSSEELTKYAIQSWFSAKPNTKDTLNRQGQKYVKFTIEDWVNEVYKGAGVGNLVKDNNIAPVKASINTTGEKLGNNQLIPIDDTKRNKIMNPIEISNMTEQDANTTPILPTIKVETGKGESHYASNIQNKTNMLTDESKKNILSSDEVNYYKQVTNEESLNKAFERLNNGGQSETMNWLKKDSKNATSVDVAEGWILLKQYQDQVQNGTDIIKKDELNRSMVEVAKKMREIGTNAGQTVQAFNILNRLTPEGMVYYAQSELSEAYEKMSKNKTKEWIDSNRDNFELTPDETQFIMDTMKEVQTMEDGYDKRVKIAEIQKVLTDKLPPAKGSALKAWMRISMLFNPKTQVRNVGGNALIAPINYFGDMFASYADKIIAKKSGVRTTGNMNVKAILKGMKQGAYEATNDYRKGINTKDMDGNRFEIGEGKSFNERTIIGKTLNRTERLLNYLMDVGDRVFSQASFENSLQNQMILNNTTEITQDMIDIARAESLQRTWNDNNDYTRFVLGVRSGLNKINVNGYGLGDVLIPFAKTPANLTKAIFDYSPAGLVKSIVEGRNLNRSLTNGQYTVQMQHKFVQDLGKATAGTMLYVLGIALAKTGITSGESDDDKDVANFLKNTLGISNYSIKIGNKSFTYDWAQPLAAPLSIMANVVNSKNNKEQALLEGIVGSLDTGGSILLEQSFLQSLNDVLNDNDGIVSGLVNEVLELPARAVPTFSKQIADMVDGIQRTSFEYGQPIKSAVNNIKSKIPFVSRTLAPSVDTMGREIQKYGGKNNIFNVFLNPANVNTENISTSAKEIYRLYKSTGETDIMPRVAPYYYINKNGEKTIMTSQQRAEYQKVSGKIIEESVNSLLNSSKYKNMNDTDKADMINKIVNYSYNKARKEILGIEMSDTYNKINMYTNDSGKVANYYLNKEEIDYSYNYPEKYKTLNQITTYDKYLTYQEKIDDIKSNYQDTTQRKTAVINYVNSLKLSVAQKAMLIKMQYSSFKNYDNQIIEYINNQKISKQDKVDILTKLGFTIKDGRVYS